MSSEAVPSFLTRAVLITALALAPAPLFAQGACGNSSLPDAVMGLGSILDSAKLINDLSLTGHEVSGVAALHFQSNGRLLRAVWIEAPAAEPVASALATAAPAALVRNVPRGKPYGVRVRVTGGTAPSLAMAPSQYCAPEPQVDNMNRPASAPSDMTRRERAEYQNAGPYRLQVDVDTLGRVGRINVIQSSGSAAADRLASDNARIMKFTPATLDGLVAPGLYEISARP